MRLDRLSLVLLIALAVSQRLPFPKTTLAATVIAIVFLVRITINMRTGAFVRTPQRVRNFHSAEAIHQLSKGA
jgi:hypothetical protein